MKLVGFIGTAILISGLAITVPAFAEHGDHGDRHGRHEDRAEHGKAAEHGRPAQRAEHHVDHRPPAHVEYAERHVDHRPPVRVEHAAVWREHRAEHWENEHRGWRERGGYHGYRVPHARYVVYFGREHRFRVHSYPVLVVAGRPRFHYHDCWITLVDPYPASWSERWYETDDVYVEYVRDGYYMYNARHPGVAIAVNLSL